MIAVVEPIKLEDSEKLTFKQSRYIFHYLGLDLRTCSSSLNKKDASDLIAQMKSDPKFVYDYLVGMKATIVDSSKIEKLISKEKVVKTKTKITKTQMCKDLYSKNNKLTTKQIANKVGCDVAVAHRALAGIKKAVTVTKTRAKAKTAHGVIQGLHDHIRQNFIEHNLNFTTEDLAKSYNSEYETKFTINQFNCALKDLVKDKSISKIDKGVYSKYVNHKSKVASACADKFIVSRINSGKLKFSLNDPVKSFPDMEARKIKKAIQNWAYSNRVVHGHKIESSSYGKYILVKVDDSHTPSVNHNSSVKSDSSIKAMQVASSLYKMVGGEAAIKLIEIIADLKNG